MPASVLVSVRAARVRTRIQYAGLHVRAKAARIDLTPKTGSVLLEVRHDMSAIYPGDTVTLYAECRNTSGALANATTATFRLRSPSGTTTTYASPSNPTTGVYEQTVEVTAAGSWVLSFEGTGTVDKYEEGSFTVQAKSF